jgi:hypothetical protein
MIFQNQTDIQLLGEPFDQRLFTRRTELSSAIRLEIAIDAISARMNRTWGTVTDLAKQYNISRAFVYVLAEKLKKAGHFLFSEIASPVSQSSVRELAIQMMASLRMEGGSSIGAISTIMGRFELALSSVGSISQILSHIGALLPKTLSLKEGATQYLIFASDELFSKTTPILVTVDPCSSAILRIECCDSRKAEDWKRHFEGIQENGIEALYVVSDDGKGIRAGHAEVMGDKIRQSDTYHAIAHRLGAWVGRLEDAAYNAIEVALECETKLDAAKSEPVREKRRAACIQANEAEEKAITLYDNFNYLYLYISSQLYVFDHKGNLRTREQAEERTLVGLELLEELGHENITKAVNKIRRALPDLFHYFDIAKKILNECRESGIDEETLKAYCVAWQWGKKIRKAKKSDRKKNAKENEDIHLELAEDLHPKNAEDIQRELYSKLDKIVQSSAMVECINSIIRPYLNTTKNHVTQELLNLIMHYHNHRRYRAGLRKGKTPMELLTGEEQTKDWIAILFDIIREKDPEFLLEP